MPACDRCRQRKVRCNIEVPGQPCALCHEKQWPCQFTNSRRGETEALSGPPLKRTRRSREDNSPEEGSHRPARNNSSRTDHSQPPLSSSKFSNVTGTSPTESSMIVGPAVAEDVQILEQYLTSQKKAPPSKTQTYNLVSNVPGNPILYLSVPKRREGLTLDQDPGNVQRTIFEQILGPFKDDLLSLYFDHLHPSFPILDEQTFLNLRQRPSALLCELYALALPLWARSERLRGHPCPDVRYAWNLAVAALQDDFMAPSISTVHSSLLDMTGRPIKFIVGNIVNTGRTVALAHSLGLNRDPTTWKTTVHEKNVRIRLWWGVFIHDTWSSFAHGIPPHISKDHFDVPVPTIQNLLSTGQESERRIRAAESFIQLCSLSQILGDILPLVYNLKLDHKDAWKKIRRLECSLEDWETNLPEYLRAPVRDGVIPVSGSSCLYFNYLSIKLLLCRVALRSCGHSSELSMMEARQYRLAMLREAAVEVATYVCSLSRLQLQEFWLPYTAHLLVSATTILLRCTIETVDHGIADSCKAKLAQLRSRLQDAKDEDDWDLADFCISRCHEAIAKVTSRSSTALITSYGHETVQENRTDTAGSQDDETSAQRDIFHDFGDFPDLLIPVDSLDYPWETLWETLNGPAMISI